MDNFTSDFIESFNDFLELIEEGARVQAVYSTAGNVAGNSGR